MKTFIASLTLVLAATVAQAQTIGEIMAQNQTVFRDAGGRTIGTATIDSQGTTTFRDSGGRTTGTATFSNQGSAGNTTTFRDAGGRTTGTAATPPTLTFEKSR